ncbi:ribonuclease H-like domain-containing protein [Desulfospira joergensenii]|uniref:ribonuclease H-like domain-containing protein n=1 Tax=Desulfospira joergensenii TaxID=53329 RepID=UPI0003B79218|nr:ribonuclease H-like domain-containing protein [Desulfospira joergensenii]
MLKNSFQHIPGIGAKTEEQIWDCGIRTWQDVLKGDHPGISSQRLANIREHIQDSLENLDNPIYFSDLLPAREHWRLFPEFRNSMAYLDIETTGLDMWGAEITTIALYDGKKISYYVQGRNLNDFKEDIQNYNIIVTYNGKIFDQPFIEKYFSTKLDQAHIDLRYILKSLGYSGGLKRCEKALGLDRGDLDGVDGYFAVLLWQEYQQNGNEKALETLLAYNIEDVVNLETLMVLAYNMKMKSLPFFHTLELPMPMVPKIPFLPDSKTIHQIQQEAFSSFGRF